jgi:hypothetical protein
MWTLLKKRVKKIKMAWSKPFRDIETSYRLLVSDVQVLNDNVEALHTHVGNPVQVKGTDPTFIWGALNVLASAQSNLEAASEIMEEGLLAKVGTYLESHPSFREKIDGIERLEHLSDLLDSRLSALENSLRIHRERFKHIKQVLQQIPSLVQLDLHATRLDALEERLTSCEAQSLNVRNLSTDPSISTPAALAESISAMQEEI